MQDEPIAEAMQMELSAGHLTMEISLNELMRVGYGLASPSRSGRGIPMRSRQWGACHLCI